MIHYMIVSERSLEMNAITNDPEWGKQADEATLRRFKQKLDEPVCNRPCISSGQWDAGCWCKGIVRTGPRWEEKEETDVL